MTLIDTPGPGLGERTRISKAHRGLPLMAATAAPPPARVALPHAALPPATPASSEAFPPGQLAHPSPVNAIAILSRADRLGSGRPDALRSAQQVANRLSRRRPGPPPLPDGAAGGPASWPSPAPPCAESGYRRWRLRGAAKGSKALLLASVDRFVAGDPGSPARQGHANLVRRLGLFGVGLAVRLIASGGPTPTAGPPARRPSGVDDLSRPSRPSSPPAAGLLQAQAALPWGAPVGAADGPIDATPTSPSTSAGQAGAHPSSPSCASSSAPSARCGHLPAPGGEVDRLLGSNGTAPAVRLGLPGGRRSRNSCGRRCSTPSPGGVGGRRAR